MLPNACTRDNDTSVCIALRSTLSCKASAALFFESNEIEALTSDKYNFVLSRKEQGANVHGFEDTTMPARKTDKNSKPAVRTQAKRTAAQGSVATTLPEAMTGRASPAKAAVGDKPVFACQ